MTYDHHKLSLTIHNTVQIALSMKIKADEHSLYLAEDNKQHHSLVRQ